eukprot:2225819-Pleurochrysis_carterae.AAC.1
MTLLAFTWPPTLQRAYRTVPVRHVALVSSSPLCFSRRQCSFTARKRSVARSTVRTHTSNLGATYDVLIVGGGVM